MSAAGPTILVGGIGQLFQCDEDVGRLAIERYHDQAPDGTHVEDLSYGAIGVYHRVRDLDPYTLVLVGSSQRGDEPGTVRRRRVHDVDRTAAELQGAVADAGTGYVDLELAIEVLYAFEALPPRTIAIEIEPAATGPGDHLSPEVAAAIEPALDVVAREVSWTPLLELAATLRDRVDDDVLEPSPILDALRATLDGLTTLDRDGRWGRTLAEAARLRLAVSEYGVSGGMEHTDWAMLWALLEEIEQRQVDGVDVID